MEIELNHVGINNTLIDIRTPFEFNEYSIPGSINIPRINLLNSPEVYLNKYDTYYLICSKGVTSLSTAKLSNSLGYKCYSIIGGIDNLK